METIKEEIKPLSSSDESTKETVAEIIQNVKQRGDDALIEYSGKFDHIHLDNLRLDKEEIARRLCDLDKGTKKLIDRNIIRITRFVKFQYSMYRNMNVRVDNGGTLLGQKVVPIEIVGAYIPAGRFPLLSVPLMTVIPAKVAGVKTIIVSTPPGTNRPHPATLYGMVAAGATDIFTIGGAQAIAAMAYGTKSVPKVEKIVGPGNRFVNEAKKQVFGEVGIDLLAGPSEVLVFADERAVFEHVVFDLLAQAEHDPDARACLVTTSSELASKVNREISGYIENLETRDILKRSWNDHGRIVLVESIQEGINCVNDYAPEHLELHLAKRNMSLAFRGLRNYGSIFLGDNTPVVFSDKLIGTNHVLPTGRSARYTGGLNVGTFLKILTYQDVRSKTARRLLAQGAAMQSHIENLAAHAKSAELRK